MLYKPLCAYHPTEMLPNSISRINWKLVPTKCIHFEHGFGRSQNSDNTRSSLLYSYVLRQFAMAQMHQLDIIMIDKQMSLWDLMSVKRLQPEYIIFWIPPRILILRLKNLYTQN